MAALFHPENLRRIPFAGKTIQRLAHRRITQVMHESKRLQDPDISVVIRTRNDIAYLPTLFEDIKSQKFSGRVEIILVDTESTDGTKAFAEQHGAKVLSIKQKDFSYPRALNLGFQAATHPYVVTIVGHTWLLSAYMFKCVTVWSQDSKFGGLYGAPLPNWNSSRTEKLAWIFGGGKRWFSRPIVMREPVMGILAANTSIIKKSAWQSLGGYDESYAGGGEDSALGKSMLEAGYTIIREPLGSIYHSHNLGPINMLRQIFHWMKVAKPSAFDAKKVLRRRPDLRT